MNELDAGKFLIEQIGDGLNLRNVVVDQFSDKLPPSDHRWPVLVKLGILDSLTPTVFAISPLGFEAGEQFRLGGEVVFMEKADQFPPNPFAFQISDRVWLQPGHAEKLCMDDGSFVLSKLGAFYSCDRIYGHDDTSSNCLLVMGKDLIDVTVLITKRIEPNGKFICKLFDPTHGGLIDVQKHSWLKMIVSFMFEFEFEIDQHPARLTILKDITDQFFGKVKSFKGVLKFLENVKEIPNCISNILNPCVKAMETYFPPGELEPVLFANGVPQAYGEVHFPINHLLFSAIRDPFVFLPGQSWENTKKILYVKLYIERQQYLKNVARRFIRPDLNSILGFADVDGEYLHPIRDDALKWI